MLLVYNLFIFFYELGIRIAALSGNQKAGQWIEGRKNIFSKLSKLPELPRLPDGQGTSNSRLIWFHCSSLGEFEQGRPVIEKLKIKNEKLKIVLTFFSPSGYEVRKNYAGADFVCYLPLDTRRNAKRFIELVKPNEAYFVKYEYWHYYFHALKEKNIPLYIVSAIFRDDQVFFRWYGKFFRNMLKCVAHFFVQDESSLKKLNALGFSNATVTGDTRFDRVAEIAGNPKEFPLLEKFSSGKKMIIAGSTWYKDEKIIYDLSRVLGTIYDLKIIIAPHDISENRIKEVENLFAENKAIRYSLANEQNVSDKNVMIIDSIGMLASLYRYGWITYVGGGFDNGIHNILEAAVYSKPVFFGPRHHKAAEAIALIKNGGAFSVIDAKQMIDTLEKFKNDESYYANSCEASRRFVSGSTGATKKILDKTSS
jgi:3-deoxy-D-manno-octulosonic-acid transferase